MVIFIKPKDIPSVVNFIASVWRKIKLFMQRMHTQINLITSEIDDTQEIIEDTFHDRIEKLRLKINEEPDFFEYDDGNKKQPTLDIPKRKSSVKSNNNKTKKSK